MQSNFFRYHFGLEWEKRKIVRKVHAKRILQTAPHSYGENKRPSCTALNCKGLVTRERVNRAIGSRELIATCDHLLATKNHSRE